METRLFFGGESFLALYSKSHLRIFKTIAKLLLTYLSSFQIAIRPEKMFYNFGRRLFALLVSGVFINEVRETLNCGINLLYNRYFLQVN